MWSWRSHSIPGVLVDHDLASELLRESVLRGAGMKDPVLGFEPNVVVCKCNHLARNPRRSRNRHERPSIAGITDGQRALPRVTDRGPKAARARWSGERGHAAGYLGGRDAKPMGPVEVSQITAATDPSVVGSAHQGGALSEHDRRVRVSELGRARHLRAGPPDVDERDAAARNAA